MRDVPDNSRQTPMGPLVPAAMHGSPADMAPAPDDALSPEHVLPMDSDVPWWRPGWGDVARVIGWRWLLLGPALIVGVLGPLDLMFQWVFAPLFALIIKLTITAWGIVISIVACGLRNTVRARKDAFCIHCGYSLESFGERGRCPECGRPFDRAIIAEFRKDPHFFAQRHKALRDARRSMVFRAGAGPTSDDGTR